LNVRVDQVNVPGSGLAILAASEIEELELVQGAMIDPIVRLVIDYAAFDTLRSKIRLDVARNVKVRVHPSIRLLLQQVY